MAKIKAKKYQIIEVKKNKSLADLKLKIDLSLIPDKLFLKNTEHDRLFILVEKDTYCYGGHVCVNISTEDRKTALGTENIKIAEYTFANVYSDVSENVFENIILMTETYLKINHPLSLQRMYKKDAPTNALKTAKHLMFSEKEDCLEKGLMMDTLPFMPSFF